MHLVRTYKRIGSARVARCIRRGGAGFIMLPWHELQFAVASTLVFCNLLHDASVIPAAIMSAIPYSVFIIISPDCCRDNNRRNRSPVVLPDVR